MLQSLCLKPKNHFVRINPVSRLFNFISNTSINLIPFRSDLLFVQQFGHNLILASGNVRSKSTFYEWPILRWMCFRYKNY